MTVNGIDCCDQCEVHNAIIKAVKACEEQTGRQVGILFPGRSSCKNDH